MQVELHRESIKEKLPDKDKKLWFEIFEVSTRVTTKGLRRDMYAFFVTLCRMTVTYFFNLLTEPTKLPLDCNRLESDIIIIFFLDVSLHNIVLSVITSRS